MSAPEGFRRVGAIYASTDPASSELVITGMPPREFDGAETFAAHNCDAMGCGQDHVVFRADSAKAPVRLSELGFQVLALVANAKR